MRELKGIAVALEKNRSIKDETLNFHMNEIELIEQNFTEKMTGKNTNDQQFVKDDMSHCESISSSVHKEIQVSSSSSYSILVH